MNEKIDFVILWVDGDDDKWQEQKKKYSSVKENDTNSAIRFRDWGTLRYWFRGVEKFAPWVNNIFFITNGQKPEWLDDSNPKLKFIKHSDYIPDQYLPTFNSNVIELFLNKIEEISEHFVLFNDDMFIVNHVDRTDFFEHGFPKDNLVFNCVSSKKDNNTIEHIILNDVEIISKYFTKKEVIKHNKWKIFNYKNGKLNIKSFMLLPWKYYTGFENFHIPTSYLKSTWNKVWELEYDSLINMANNKFRTKEDYSHWLFRYWQLVSGEFVLRNIKDNKYYDLKNENKKFFDEIISGKYKMICLNDSDSSINFEKTRREMLGMFETLLPNKSSFEL